MLRQCRWPTGTYANFDLHKHYRHDISYMNFNMICTHSVLVQLCRGLSRVPVHGCFFDKPWDIDRARDR